MDKHAIEEKRKKELKVLFNDRDLFDLDLYANERLDDYEYESNAAKFRVAMEATKITTLGEYRGHDSEIKLSCDICRTVWASTPNRAVQFGCPECRKVLLQSRKERRLWERTRAIIIDKGGKVIKTKDITQDYEPTVDDKFIVMCGMGHKFTTSHKKIRRNTWCPVCPKQKYSHKVASKAVYKSHSVTVDKQQQLNDCCNSKGTSLLSMKNEDNTYHCPVISAARFSTKWPLKF